MKNKFVFVNLTIDPGYPGTINHGIAYLIPILEKYDYDVKIIQIEKKISDEEFVDKIKEIAPSIVGFSLTTNQFNYLIKYSSALKKSGLKTLQIAGGKHPTLAPEKTLLKSYVDGVCIGEGEIPLENLLKNIESKANILNTDGFYWNINGKIKKNPIPQFITDLSNIEFPDYSKFNKEDILSHEHNQDGLRVIISRGCPFQCTYCCNKALSEIYTSGNDYFRLPSVGYAIKLLERMIQKYPEAKSFFFMDDNLIAKKTWFINFAEQYSKKINLPCKIGGRFENINRDILAALKKMNCKTILCGLESGNEHIRKNLLNRNQSNKLIMEKSKMIKKSRIKLFTFNIVGFPFETKEQIRETLKLNKKIKPDEGVCTFFYPYPNTALYDICVKHNLLKNKKELLAITNYSSAVAIKMPPDVEKTCVDIRKKIMSYLLERHIRRQTGFFFYYFARPIFELSFFLKSKSVLYAKIINLVKNEKRVTN